ncbi:60S acidic ribosomal protein P0-like [Cynara cardunculus var. scolymus]|uniref:Ribosomal protein L10/acidic P0 n=1 Tax=Cynara cardunculus var. scolymus TaxID=59895 RepID=A0A103Y9W1_CYNCS|nr:60S acidic ribosomal protein P0-like [Cynara cardunculus var. scolymus]KVI05155.1 hypothetical protein Ccrd_016472 [Cynara cardunculus var. scolymus]
MASKAVRKAIYHQKLRNHLKDHTQIVIVGADNLRANQIQVIRQGLRGVSEVVMGKNTLMRRSIAIHAPATGNTAFLGLISHIVGKVGLVFSAGDPNEVSEAVAGYNLQPLLCSSMDIGICSHWQWLLSSHLDLVSKSSNV